MLDGSSRSAAPSDQLSGNRILSKKTIHSSYQSCEYWLLLLVCISCCMYLHLIGVHNYVKRLTILAADDADCWQCVNCTTIFVKEIMMSTGGSNLTTLTNCNIKVSW